MNKKLTVLAAAAAFTFSAAAWASADNFADNGPYVIGQMGLGSVEPGFFDNFLNTTQIRDQGGLAARAGVGYQLNRYFAVEGGLSAYSSAVRRYDSNEGILPFSGTVADSKINNIYALDAMGQVRLPVGNYFFMGVGAGLAAMHFSYGAMNASNGNTTFLSWDAGSAYFVAPKTEIRIGAKVNQQLAVFVSGSYIYSVNGNNLQARYYQPGLAMLSAGVSYRF